MAGSHTPRQEVVEVLATFDTLKIWCIYACPWILRSFYFAFLMLNSLCFAVWSFLLIPCWDSWWLKIAIMVGTEKGTKERKMDKNALEWLDDICLVADSLIDASLSSLNIMYFVFGNNSFKYEGIPRDFCSLVQFFGYAKIFLPNCSSDSNPYQSHTKAISILKPCP